MLRIIQIGIGRCEMGENECLSTYAFIRKGKCEKSRKVLAYEYQNSLFVVTMGYKSQTHKVANTSFSIDKVDIMTLSYRRNSICCLLFKISIKVLLDVFLYNSTKMILPVLFTWLTLTSVSKRNRN